MHILTLNCRSYSVQYQLFDWEQRQVLAHGRVERIVVGDSFITMNVPRSDSQDVDPPMPPMLHPDDEAPEPRGGRTYHLDGECADHKDALALILSTLTDVKIGVISEVGEIAAVGHRVVHGGEKFTESALIDEEVIAAIKEMASLAPLHNPQNLSGILAARELLPALPQVAIFDTAFHQTMPEAAYMYPLPYEWYKKHGVRRYGFHGQSHLHAARRGAELAGVPVERANMITVHTGNGVSLCALRNGVSVDTSMGLTPLEGVMMGNRSGDIDAGIIPFMMKEAGISANELEILMNQKSGVAGIVGRRVTRRMLIDEANDGDERCALALQMEAYRLRKYLGGYLAVIGKPDAIVFTYGEGWADWPIRGMALRDMEQFGIKLDAERDLLALLGEGEVEITAADSAIKVFVIPSGEDLVLNEDVAAILGWDQEREYEPEAAEYAPVSAAL